MICEYSATAGWRPSSTISMLMKSVTKPPIVGAWPSRGSLKEAPAPAPPLPVAVMSSSTPRFASSRTPNSCVLTCGYSSPGSGVGVFMFAATP